MKKNERLFLAIGGADGDLLRRSERTGGRRLWGGVLTAAACLALLLTALLPRLTGGGGGVTPPPGGPDDSPGNPSVVVTPPEDTALPTDNTVRFAPQSADAVFHFLQHTSDEAVPGFTIYINEEIYALSEENGSYVVRPREPVQIPGVSPCELWITHRGDLSMEEARTSLPEIWRENYPELTGWEDSPFTGGPHLCGWNGTEWDADYFEAFLFEDGRDGVYVVTFTCFTEAAEGHGARFGDMIRTFRPVQQGIPAWLTDLDSAAQAVTRAVLADDLSGAAAYLAEDAEMEGYGEDVSAYASVTSFNYTVDDVQQPARAIVSVQCRVDLEESWDYLTMELEYGDGTWKAIWSGLEK